MAQQITVKDVVDTVQNTFYEYNEEGYCSEEIEESGNLDDINKKIEEIYKLLTPKKIEQLDEDLDDIEREIKEKIESIVEDCLISYRKRLEVNLKRLDNSTYINSQWYLNLKLK